MNLCVNVNASLSNRTFQGGRSLQAPPPSARIREAGQCLATVRELTQIIPISIIRQIPISTTIIKVIIKAEMPFLTRHRASPDMGTITTTTTTTTTSTLKTTILSLSSTVTQTSRTPAAAATITTIHTIIIATKCPHRHRRLHCRALITTIVNSISSKMIIPLPARVIGEEEVAIPEVEAQAITTTTTHTHHLSHPHLRQHPVQNALPARPAPHYHRHSLIETIIINIIRAHITTIIIALSHRHSLVRVKPEVAPAEEASDRVESPISTGRKRSEVTYGQHLTRQSTTRECTRTSGRDRSPDLPHIRPAWRAVPVARPVDYSQTSQTLPARSLPVLLTLRA